MAHIKCRYMIPYCRYDGENKRLQHSIYDWCDTKMCCEKYTRPQNAGMLVNPQCIYCDYVSGEFEKTVKRYEYSNDEYHAISTLKIGNEVYDELEIEYLEIDGRVLIDDADGGDAE